MTPLHSIGEAIRQLLVQVPPPAARGLFVLILSALLLWVLLLPPSQTQPTDRPARLTERLKFWAALALAVQLLIYLLF